MNQPKLTKETEVRKLTVSNSQQLATLLDGDDSILSLLMGSVVKDLDDPSSELRFTSNDIDHVRNHSQEIRKSAILIFLDEWSTMGKSRPKLGHLLALLIKCQLFRAADFLASLINEPQPRRPEYGPAARVKIDIDLPDDIVEVVNGLEYPFSGSEVNNNQQRPKPEIIAPNMNFATDSSTNGNISLPLIPVPSNRYISSAIFNTPSTANVNFSRSNLIKFSQNFTPNQSLAPAAALQSEAYIPALSALQSTKKIPMTVDSNQNIAQDENVPAISALLIKETTTNISDELPATLMSFEVSSKTNEYSNANIPMISALITDDSTSQSHNDMTTQSTISSTDSD